MALDKKVLRVPRTARYYTIGKYGPKTKRVWMVLHGYGLSAEFFIKKFAVLDDGATFIIAPEGLSRFYQEGFNGRVGASWMTREEREGEMQDQFDWFESVLREEGVDSRRCELILLGFSQGAPAACRWMVRSQHSVHRLVIWGSDIPADVLQEPKLSLIQAAKPIVFVGDEDEFINEERLDKVKALFEDVGLNYTFKPYKGTHRIYSEMLTDLDNEL